MIRSPEDVHALNPQPTSHTDAQVRDALMSLVEETVDNHLNQHKCAIVSLTDPTFALASAEQLAAPIRQLRDMGWEVSIDHERRTGARMLIKPAPLVAPEDPRVASLSTESLSDRGREQFLEMAQLYIYAHAGSGLSKAVLRDSAQPVVVTALFMAGNTYLKAWEDEEGMTRIECWSRMPEGRVIVFAKLILGDKEIEISGHSVETLAEQIAQKTDALEDPHG